MKKISKDENNFALEVSNLELDSKYHANFLSRLKGCLRREYGKCSLAIKPDDKIKKGTFRILVPNDFESEYQTITNLIEEVYNSIKIYKE